MKLSAADGFAAVGWDLDSTVFDTRHRQHMIPLIKEGKCTWDEYALQCTGDSVLPGRIEMMKAFHEAGLFNIGVSGRSDVARDQTWEVIHRLGVPLDEVNLRRKEDYSPNAEHKVRVIRERQSLCRWNFFFEDWRETGDVIMRETGVPVIILDPCYPATAANV